MHTSRKQNIPKNLYCIFVSETYSVWDCIKYIPIRNNALEDGQINHQNYGKSSVELSNEWSTVGDYSIKGTSISWGWFRWVLYQIFENPTVTFDIKTDQPVRACLYVTQTDQTYISVTVGESTQTLTLDTTDITPTLLDLRIINTSSTVTATTYVDNIRIY